MAIEDDNAVEPVVVAPREVKHCAYHASQILRPVDPPPTSAPSVTDKANALLAEKEEDEDNLIAENINRKATDIATPFLKINPPFVKLNGPNITLRSSDKIFSGKKLHTSHKLDKFIVLLRVPNWNI